MEKEREDDLQNLWVLIQGSRDQAQHSPTGHVGCGPCRQMLYVLRPSSLHSNDILMRTMATLWPPQGVAGKPSQHQVAKCRMAKTNVSGSMAPFLHSLEPSLRTLGDFPELK